MHLCKDLQNLLFLCKDLYTCLYLGYTYTNAPRIGNGFVIIVSVTGGSNRCVSGDMALVHRFSSCCLLSQLLLTPPRSRSDGPFAVAASICGHYHVMTDKNMINNFTSHSSLVDIQFIHNRTISCRLSMHQQSAVFVETLHTNELSMRVYTTACVCIHMRSYLISNYTALTM